MSIRKKLLVSAGLLAGLYALLLIPDPDSIPVHKPGGKPFAWNRDTTWNRLETIYRESRQLDRAVLKSALVAQSTRAEERLKEIQDTAFGAGDKVWSELENDFFAMAPLVAIHADHFGIAWFISYYNRVRTTVKRQSAAWDMSSEQTRRTLYTLLYGMRSAVEEVLLVSGTKNFDPAIAIHPEASATPSATLRGITVHSGDLLVSRGGAEVSALISRGNDFPGNFSHVALLYVEPGGKPWFVESHIEKGVAIATAEEYLADKKLRFMVMRPRADLPRISHDRMLPHKAAEYMYRRALAKHIPYDFKMEFHDPSAMFCSEVGSYAYKRYDISLWQGVSTISSPGVVNWLHAFGVENFVTQMPSDLEYDPQLSVVAEWRDAETLLKDHIDNAVMDVLLQQADRGKQITYSIWQLPFVRVVKGYCLVLNMFGKPGIIPEGMSATQALKNNTFVAMHVELKERTERAVREFIRANGYTPPYWQIIALAEQEAKR